jgi:hypothetical protein
MGCVVKSQRGRESRFSGGAIKLGREELGKYRAASCGTVPGRTKEEDDAKLRSDAI